jgi:hypothetical protein
LKCKRRKCGWFENWGYIREDFLGNIKNNQLKYGLYKPMKKSIISVITGFLFITVAFAQDRQKGIYKNLGWQESFKDAKILPKTGKKPLFDFLPVQIGVAPVECWLRICLIPKSLRKFQKGNLFCTKPIFLGIKA